MHLSRHNRDFRDRVAIERSGWGNDIASAQIELILRNLVRGKSCQSFRMCLGSWRSIMRVTGTGALGAAVVAIGLFGCMAASEVSVLHKVNEAEFRERIVGAKLVWKDGETRYFADGTFSGNAGDKSLQGKWTFENGQYCRSGSIGGKPFPYACETVKIEGDTVRFSGTGTTYVYKIRK
jgi:hypothetical protein